jgi:hypothetical protein
VAKDKIFFKGATLEGEFLKPNYSKGAHSVIKVLSYPYLKYVEGIKSIEIKNIDTLIENYTDFYDDKVGLVLAFRHTAKEDAPLLVHALNHQIDKKLKKIKKSYSGHAHFIYGSDVLNWATKLSKIVFPALGAIPVQNRSLNKEGLTILKDIIKKGEFPVALAPESQVTYHMYKCDEISNGVSTFALWSLERFESVKIVPISIGYHHHKDHTVFVNELLKNWEKQTNIQLTKENLVERLIEATDHTLTLLETFYNVQSYSENRVENLCENIMAQQEYLADIIANGSMLDRLFNLRYSSLKRLYLKDDILKNSSDFKKSNLKWEAVKGHLLLRNSQVIDILKYIDPTYIEGEVSGGRLNEYALNLLDILNRFKGGNIDSRYSPKQKEALIFIGEPIEIKKTDIVKRKESAKRLESDILTSLNETSLLMESYWEKPLNT